jgi:hypothetical protein
VTDGVDPAIIAAATAAEEQAELALQEEEETMAHYGHDDLDGDWEFKIVRSSWPAFANPEEFARLLEEESRFGWVMLEKLDDSRVRFKRRRGAHIQAMMVEPGQDSYRTNYGLPRSARWRLSLVIIGVLIIAFFVWSMIGAR